MGQLKEIDQKMSVNFIRSRVPQTDGYFQSLKVDFIYEGCDSLEEIAWKKGLDIVELMRQLQEM